MTAIGLLNSGCELWMERDDGCGGDGTSIGPAAPGSTWRDWMMDFLLVAYAMGEELDPRRPNCGAGWQDHLDEALSFHDTSFSEVLAEAFGAYQDSRPRRVLRPFGTQLSSLERLGASSLDTREEAPDPAGQAAVVHIVDLVLARERDIRSGGTGHVPSIEMEELMDARRHARARTADYGKHSPEGTRWNALMDYLDAVILRRHPTHCFLGMPLHW